jgi:hypothetical protein
MDNEFLNKTPVAQETVTIIDKWDCFNLKSFYPMKGIIIRVRTLLIEWEKSLPALHPI